MLTALTAIGAWLYANTAGNIVASVMCGVAVWFWKIRPHLKAQRAHREAETAHRVHVAQQLKALADHRRSGGQAGPS